MKDSTLKLSVHGDNKDAAKRAADAARASGKYRRVLVSAQRDGYTVYAVKKGGKK